jgi:Fatty acid hydroxylase
MKIVHSKVKTFVPFLIYLPVSLTLSWFALTTRRFSVLALTLLLFAGLVSWGLVEYILHRFIFHFDAVSERGKAFVYAVHLSHHEHPRRIDNLFAGLRTSVSVAVIYFLIAWLVLRTWQAASLLFAGLVLGYCFYEYVHYMAHHASPPFRVLRYLKKYHMLHHHQSPDMRFGVTSPIFDILLATYRPVRNPAPHTTFV